MRSSPGGTIPSGEMPSPSRPSNVVPNHVPPSALPPHPSRLPSEPPSCSSGGCVRAGEACRSATGCAMPAAVPKYEAPTLRTETSMVTPRQSTHNLTGATQCSDLGFTFVRADPMQTIFFCCGCMRTTDCLLLVGHRTSSTRRMPTRAPARGPSAPDGAPGGSSCLTNLTNCGTALGALQASYGLRADHARGRRLALPLPLVSDYVCDGEMVPEERRHSRTLFTPKLRGVNLGGWMVLVPWVTPSLFYQFEDQPQQRVAMDMLSFCRVLGPKEGNRQLREHWRHWVTDDDLAKLASQGINTLRVPVGDWMWEPYEPYAGCTNGSVSELKRVLRMAAKHHLRVLIDLHGAHTHARARTRARLAAAWPQPGTRPDRLGHWRWRWPRVYQRRKCGLDVPNVKPMERASLGRSIRQSARPPPTSYFPPSVHTHRPLGSLPLCSLSETSPPLTLHPPSPTRGAHPLSSRGAPLPFLVGRRQALAKRLRSFGAYDERELG